jgi:hypothetical protein
VIGVVGRALMSHFFQLRCYALSVLRAEFGELRRLEPWSRPHVASGITQFVSGFVSIARARPVLLAGPRCGRRHDAGGWSRELAGCFPLPR